MSTTARELILHVGMSKTGSTSIQRALAASGEALQTQGVYYFSSPGRVNHFLLPASLVADPRAFWGLQPARWEGLAPSVRLARFREDWRLELATLPDWATRCVISAEQISGLLRDDAAVQRLADCLAPHFARIRIIIYLRRQDRHATSDYTQKLRLGDLLPPGLPNRGPMELPIYDYAALLGRYARCFGRDAVIPRIFDREALVDGDVLADFLHTAGVTIPVESHHRQANVAINLDGQNLLIEAGKFLRTVPGGAVGRMARDWMPQGFPGRFWRPEPMQLRQVLAAYTQATRGDMLRAILAALMQRAAIATRAASGAAMQQSHLHERLGDADRAKAALLLAFRLAPEQPALRHHLVRLLRRRGETALATLHQAVALRQRRRWRWVGGSPVSDGSTGQLWKNTQQWRHLTEAVEKALPGQGWQPTRQEAQDFMVRYAACNEATRQEYFPHLCSLFNEFFDDLPEHTRLADPACAADAGLAVLAYDIAADMTREAAFALAEFRLSKRAGDLAHMRRTLQRLALLDSEQAAPLLRRLAAGRFGNAQPASTVKAREPHPIGMTATPRPARYRPLPPAPGTGSHR